MQFGSTKVLEAKLPKDAAPHKLRVEAPVVVVSCGAVNSAMSKSSTSEFGMVCSGIPWRPCSSEWNQSQPLTLPSNSQKAAATASEA